MKYGCMESELVETLKEASKMSQAAMKAWETRRANKLKLSGQASVKQTGKEKEKKTKISGKELASKISQAAGVIEVVEEVSCLEKAQERRELAELNGDELKKLVKGNGKRVDRNDRLMEHARLAEQGPVKTCKAEQVAGIVKQAKHKAGMAEGWKKSGKGASFCPGKHQELETAESVAKAAVQVSG